MILGAIASSPASDTVVVEPKWAVQNIRPGMRIILRSDCCGDRCGYAEVLRVRPEGIVSFVQSLNCLIPAAAEGDLMIEYKIPCTRCRCEECERRTAAAKVEK